MSFYFITYLLLEKHLKNMSERPNYVYLFYDIVYNYISVNSSKHPFGRA